MALNITASGGQQNATGNPQTVPSAAPGIAPRSGGGSLQPGTSRDLLNGSQGVSLGSPALTTVQLDGDPSQVRTQTQSKPAPKAEPAHEVNLAWLIIPAVFIAAAAIMFLAIARSAKSTTN